MMRVVLAGGGTAGHVNPLLAVADELVRQGSSTPGDILVIGTKEGLETRLVPEAGFTLNTIARLPFPRRINAQALLFWPRFVGAVLRSMRLLRSHSLMSWRALVAMSPRRSMWRPGRFGSPS